MACRKERVNDIKYNIKMAPSLKTGEINLQTVVFSNSLLKSTQRCLRIVELSTRF